MTKNKYRAQLNGLLKSIQEVCGKLFNNDALLFREERVPTRWGVVRMRTHSAESAGYTANCASHREPACHP